MTLMCPQRALVHGATLALRLADSPGASRGQPHPTGGAVVRVPQGLVGAHGTQFTVVAFHPPVPSITHNCKKKEGQRVCTLTSIDTMGFISSKCISRKS